MTQVINLTLFSYLSFFPRERHQPSDKVKRGIHHRNVFCRSMAVVCLYCVEGNRTQVTVWRHITMENAKCPSYSMKHELYAFIKPHVGKIDMKSLGSCSFLQQEQVIDLLTVILRSWKVVIFSWFKIRCHLQFIIIVVSQCYFTVMPPPPPIVYEITQLAPSLAKSVRYITPLVFRKPLASEDAHFVAYILCIINA